MNIGDNGVIAVVRLLIVFALELFRQRLRVPPAATYTVVFLGIVLTLVSSVREESQQSRNLVEAKNRYTEGQKSTSTLHTTLEAVKTQNGQLLIEQDKLRKVAQESVSRARYLETLLNNAEQKAADTEKNLNAKVDDLTVANELLLASYKNQSKHIGILRAGNKQIIESTTELKRSLGETMELSKEVGALGSHQSVCQALSAIGGNQREVYLRNEGC